MKSPTHTARRCTLALAVALVTASPTLAQKVNKPKGAKGDVIFSHRNDNQDLWYSRSLAAGQDFTVVINDTDPGRFQYSIAGVALEGGTEDDDQARKIQDVPIVELRPFKLPFTHDRKFGGYVVRIRANDPDDRTVVPKGETDELVLNDVTLHIAVETVGWNLDFAGAYVGSGLTDPKYAIITQENEAGDEEKVFTREPNRESDVNLGLGAFVHVYNDNKWPWLALTFGLGIDDDTTYYLGPSLRLGDKAAITAGYAWGAVDTLPGGQQLGESPISDNVLNNLGTKNEGAFFVGISYSFIPGIRDRFEKPFAGATEKDSTQEKPEEEK